METSCNCQENKTFLIHLEFRKMIGLMYLFSTKQKKHFSSIEGRERGGQDGHPLNNSNVRIILKNFFFFLGGGVNTPEN